MSDCGCGVMKASGDPNGRSISGLGGASRRKPAAKRVECAYERRKGKRRWVCRDENGRKVKAPKRKKRSRR